MASIIRFLLLSLLFISLPFIGLSERVMKWAYKKKVIDIGPGKESLFHGGLLALLMSLSTIAILVWVGFVVFDFVK